MSNNYDLPVEKDIGQVMKEFNETIDKRKKILEELINNVSFIDDKRKQEMLSMLNNKNNNRCNGNDV